jgi:two-component system LytT family response regulator
MAGEERAGFGAFIVDDEKLARGVVREMLEAHPDVEVRGEAANGLDAVKLASELRPDILFLDVQMPKLDGFEVLELVDAGIAVVFITAYDQYALRAFEVNAVDYLLKPFSRERFDEALERAKLRVGRAREPHAADLAAASRPPGQTRDRIVARDGTHVHVIPVDRLDYAEAQGDYIALWSGDRSYLKQQTMQSLEESLDPARFVRIHRSFILNIDRLARIDPSGDSWIAVLTDGRRLSVSRSGHARLRAVLGKG